MDTYQSIKKVNNNIFLISLYLPFKMGTIDAT